MAPVRDDAACQLPGTEGNQGADGKDDGRAPRPPWRR